MLRDLAKQLLEGLEGLQARIYSTPTSLPGQRGPESPTDPDTLLREARYVVFDTELTGLSKIGRAHV